MKNIANDKQLYDNNKDIKNIQISKFLKLLDHCKKNVPYYSNVLQNYNIDSYMDIARLPFLTKNIVKDNFELLKASNLHSKRFRKNSTSGSTGQVFQFYSDNKTHRIQNACATRSDSWTGWQFGEPVIILWGARHDINLFKSLKKRIINSPLLLNTRLLSSFDMTDQDMLLYIHKINSVKPTLIIGYPSSLELFASYIKTHSYEVFSPKGIITSGESLDEPQRSIIQKTFKCKVLNRYGCREVGHIASECEEQNGLHISIDHVIVEVVNEKGHQCKPGEIGDIVVTNLDNFVFPLIRYKIGDLGTLSDASCKCGKKLPILKSILGRSLDIVLGTNGSRVTGTFFPLLRYKVKGIDKIQIHQEKYGTIDIKLKANSDWNENAEKNLFTILKEKLGHEMKINLSYVDQFDLNNSGKFRWVTSTVSPFA